MVLLRSLIKLLSPNRIAARTGCLVLCAVVLASGCAAPTQTIEQSRDVSSSGLAYTSAVDSLLDQTITKVIDFNSVSLIKGRQRALPADALKASLKSSNEGILALVGELESFRRHNKLLHVYFLNLQALADSPVKDDVGAAVASLSGSISRTNQSMGGKELLTEQQQSLIGQLGGLVAQSVQSSKLKNAFERDAAIIAEQLGLHEQQLAIIAGILEDRFGAENDLFYAESVELPYADTSKSLPAGWKADRARYLRSNFTSLQLETAQAAAKQLQGVWVGIVQGGTDTGSIRYLISDIDEFVTVAGGLAASVSSN